QRITFTASQRSVDPRKFEYVMARADALYEGLPVHAQFAGRPTGVLTGLQTYHALTNRPSCRALAALPLAERAARMREPAVRAAVLSEADAPLAGRSSQVRLPSFLRALLPVTFPLGDRLDYEPDPSSAVTARAVARGISSEEILYDLLLEQDGRAML